MYGRIYKKQSINLYILFLPILSAGLGYLTYKFRFKILIILGLLVIGISFIDWIYPKDATILIGIGLLVAGIWWMKKWNPKKFFHLPKKNL